MVTTKFYALTYLTHFGPLSQIHPCAEGAAFYNKLLKTFLIPSTNCCMVAAQFCCVWNSNSSQIGSNGYAKFIFQNTQLTKPFLSTIP